MLDPDTAARIERHIERGWKLPDSLVLVLHAAYVEAERRRVEALRLIGHGAVSTAAAVLRGDALPDAGVRRVAGGGGA